MAWLREKFAEFGRRIFMFLHRDRFEPELEQEMRLHLELREQENTEGGLSPEAAHHAAPQPHHHACGRLFAPVMKGPSYFRL